MPPSFTACAGALTYGLIRGGEQGWTESGTLASLGGAALALLVFLVVERRVRRPLLDLGLLRRPSFAALLAAALLLQAAAFPYLTFVGLWVQNVVGLSPVQAGLAVTPMALMSLLVGALGGRSAPADGPQLPVGIGLLLVGAGALLPCALLDDDSGWAALVPGLAVSGLGIGAAMPVLVSAALGAAPPQRAGMASGAVNTFRQLGYALGIAVLGTVFATRCTVPHGPAPPVRRSRPRTCLRADGHHADLRGGGPGGRGAGPRGGTARGGRRRRPAERSAAGVAAARYGRARMPLRYGRAWRPLRGGRRGGVAE